MEVGPCTNYVKAWYFDSETGSCQEFSFGGCHGNLNRFATKQECESICRDKLRNNKAGKILLIFLHMALTSLC